MNSLPASPLTAQQLANWMFLSDKWLQHIQGGEVIQRRTGYSLEFHDFQHYQFGDDIRHVDWRASFKNSTGGNLLNSFQDWLVRKYHAQERVSVVVLVDNRREMTLPSTLPKRNIAAWIAEALIRISLHQGNLVRAAALFGDSEPVTFQRTNQISELNRFLNIPAGDENVNRHLYRLRLSQSSIVVVISDLYWDQQQKPVVQLLAGWRRPNRKSVFIELDSWPQERANLYKTGAIRLRNDPLHAEFHFDKKIDEEVTRLIDKNRKTLFNILGNPKHISWSWPEKAGNAADFFLKEFHQSNYLWPLLRRNQ